MLYITVFGKKNNLEEKNGVVPLCFSFTKWYEPESIWVRVDPNRTVD